MNTKSSPLPPTRNETLSPMLRLLIFTFAILLASTIDIKVEAGIFRSLNKDEMLSPRCTLSVSHLAPAVFAD